MMNPQKSQQRLQLLISTSLVSLNKQRVNVSAIRTSLLAPGVNLPFLRDDRVLVSHREMGVRRTLLVMSTNRAGIQERGG